jgi:hypothetical protein
MSFLLVIVMVIVGHVGGSLIGPGAMVMVGMSGASFGIDGVTVVVVARLSIHC